MNEYQHDRLGDYQRALSQVKLKRHELRAARLRAREKLRALREAIQRDPDSWQSTPRINVYGTVIEGEVIEDGQETEGQKQEAAAIMAPPTEPGSHIP